MTLFFFNTHVQQVDTKLSRSFAQEMALVIRQFESGAADWTGFTGRLAESEIMRLRFIPGDPQLQPPPGRACCAELRKQLDIYIEAPHVFAFDPTTDLITLRTSVSGGVLEALLERKRVVIITAHIFVVWSVGFSLLLLGAAYAFLRNQVRSILDLSRAADALGRGEDAPSYKPSGAREVRQAAQSIIRMRNRLRRYADQRTAMLAGVSHDLRTPLTRLRLELALLPKDIDLSAAKADIAEMERMLDAYLAFARGEESETPVESDLTGLVRDAVQHAATRSTLSIDAPSPIQMRLRPLALKRAVTNLANNAADHATNVLVRAVRDGSVAVITVEDDGPGIPAEQREDAFKPFSRLDGARNQNVSGVGLGLTIARDAARAHGGDVTLARSTLGGLKAVMRLPLEPQHLADRSRDD
ncbi:HAMP domain-containing protein [bacterium]|nr:HAMP domain-containing protein [bacterium]